MNSVSMRSLEPPYLDGDAGGMVGRIDDIPAAVLRTLDGGAAKPWGAPATAADLLVVGALGGSAIAADLTAGLYFDRLPRPLLTVREYRWPACVGPRTLALLSSYSGETEETLALYRDAGDRGAARAGIGSGGTLGSWCERDRVPFTRVPGGSPPRAALFPSWIALTGLLNGLGWIEDPESDWREAARLMAGEVARLGPQSPEATNPAKQLARALHGRLIFIYAASERLGAVATRWRNQINENAKLLGHSALVPELNHNEIVGWEVPRAPHGMAAVVTLRDSEDSPAVSKRLTLTAEYAAAHGATRHEWSAPAGGRLARMAALVLFADYLSFYLALLNGADPTPIASIDEFKRRLAAP